ncbi:MAG TPA: hypothetical protein VFF18_12055 [Woeseiaceae bacterium]|nr:hypothetical protein [Woeseiaceae bacterium]
MTTSRKVSDALALGLLLLAAALAAIAAFDAAHVGEREHLELAVASEDGGETPQEPREEETP